MTPDHRFWIVQLLFVALTLVIGVVGVVSARSLVERRLLRGLFGQGVLIAMVVAAATFPDRSELRLAGLVIVAALLIQALWESAGSSSELGLEQERERS